MFQKARSPLLVLHYPVFVVLASMALCMAPALAIAESPVSNSGALLGAGLVAQAGNAGIATDKIQYDGDENIAMTFAPIDTENHHVQLAYAHLKADANVSKDNPVDFVIPATVTDQEGTDWTVTAVGYDSKYATTESSDGGGGNYDLTDGVKTNGSDFDKDCFKLVAIPSSVTTLKSSCFSSWAIENVVFEGESNLDSLGYCVFAYCENLRNIDIPASVKEIGGSYGPFEGSGLESILIPKTVERITGYYTFANCNSLKSVVFEDGFAGEVDAGNMFEKCVSLESVDFGRGTSISLPSSMFKGCTSLREVFNLNGPLGETVFDSCSSLKEIRLGSGSVEFGARSLAGDKSLSNLYFYADSNMLFKTNAQNRGVLICGSGGFRENMNMVFMGTSASVEDEGSNTFGEGKNVFPAAQLNVFNNGSQRIDEFFQGVQVAPPNSIKRVAVNVNLIDISTESKYSGSTVSPIVKATSKDGPVDVSFTATRKGSDQQADLKDPGDYTITVTKVDDVEVDGPTFDFSITRSDAAQTAYDDIDSVTVPESAEDSEAIATAEQAALKALESYNALTDTEKASVGNYVSLLEKRVAIAELKVAAAEAKAATSDAKVAAVEQELNTVKEELKEAQAKLDAASASGATSAKQASKMTVKAKTVKAKAKKKTSLKAKKAFAVQGAAGKVTFKKISGNKKIKVSSNGKVTVKKGLKKKTYKVKVQVADAGNAQFAPVSKTVTLKVKVK